MYHGENIWKINSAEHAYYTMFLLFIYSNNTNNLELSYFYFCTDPNVCYLHGAVQYDSCMVSVGVAWSYTEQFLHRKVCMEQWMICTEWWTIRTEWWTVCTEWNGTHWRCNSTLLSISYTKYKFLKIVVPHAYKVMKDTLKYEIWWKKLQLT